MNMAGKIKNMGIKGKLKKISREQLICLAAAAALAGISAFISYDSSFLKEGGSIERGDPGSADLQYELKVRGPGGEAEEINVTVSAREFTEDEARAEIGEVMEELALYISGDNENLNRVSSDLSLKKTIPGHEGVRLSWYPEDPELISYEGAVNNLDLTEAAGSSLRVILRAGKYREEFSLPVRVFPPDKLTAEDIMKKLNRAIAAADEAQINSKSLQLPTDIGGTEIFYEVPANTGWIRILLMGAAAFVLLGLRPVQNRRQKLKERETELLLDYSELVSKLVIYMGAGMTVRNAWIKIAENYSDAVSRGMSKERAAYEEMKKTGRELEKGVPESRAFSDFAGRCSPSCYLKLISLLEQNRKIGDPRSENAMLLEAQEAFEQRKNTAKRLGEEAGTKLMLPLIISLVTVMIIVALPAMMTLI